MIGGAGAFGGAGDGNRTRVTSLEDWGSTIELRPRAAGLTRLQGQCSDTR